MSHTWLETRTSLVRRLQSRKDQTGWEEFVDTYGRVIHAVATKSGLCQEEAEDVTQDTLLEVAKRIGGFDPDRSKGSFKAWLLTIARSRIVDCIRRRQREKLVDVSAPESTTRTTFFGRIPDASLPTLEAVYEAEWQKTLYLAARDRVRSQTSPKQYQMFDLLVVQEWPVAKVAETLRVTPNQVYIAKHRVAEAIAAEVARLAAGKWDGEPGRPV